MAKKITGESKLVKTLSPEQQQAISQNKLISKRINIKPTSFRLNAEDKFRLKTIVGNINEVSSKKISETMIIKALILYGLKTKPEKLISLIRESLL